VRLKVFLDFKSPAAYLAMKPTLELIEQFQPAVEWLPVRSTQEDVSELPESAGKPRIHRHVRRLARRNTHLLYANLHGLEMTFPPAVGSTDAALCGLQYVLATDSNPLPFIFEAFKAYWVRHQDLNDPQVVCDILSGSGYDARGFDLESELARLPESLDPANQAGVFDAPTYWIDGQIFLGREHLPWIRSILAQEA